MKILKPGEITSFPQFRQLSPEELREAYALARAAFTAQDLQRYTEIEDGIPAEEVLRELEATERELDQKKT